jgi:hypothetical protein
MRAMRHTVAEGIANRRLVRLEAIAGNLRQPSAPSWTTTVFVDNRCSGNYLEDSTCLIWN